MSTVPDGAPPLAAYGTWVGRAADGDVVYLYIDEKKFNWIKGLKINGIAVIKKKHVQCCIGSLTPTQLTGPCFPACCTWSLDGPRQINGQETLFVDGIPLHRAHVDGKGHLLMPPTVADPMNRDPGFPKDSVPAVGDVFRRLGHA